MYINVDNGGTFTDFWAFDTDRKFRVKARTTPHDLSECLFEGLRLLSEEIYRKADVGRLLGDTKYIRYSTTQGTNALVQRKGPRVGLILPSEETATVMRAGSDENAEMFEALVGTRIEVIDPTTLADATPEDAALADVIMQAVNRLTGAGANRIVVSLGDRQAEQLVQKIAARRFPQHLLGTVPILKASDLTSDADRARATWTATLNAFLHPAMERFLFNTDNRLKAMNFSAPLLVFRNDGMAGRVAKTPAIKTYGSGPEGGVCGAVALSKTYGFNHLVTIDVGGTTTDFGIVADGEAVRHQFGKLETVEVSMPMSDLRSIGVGGGSVIRAVDGAIKVGPESVGAAPGPACFGFGGTEATITDVKLLKGVIDPDHYFGGRMQLDPRRAEAVLADKVGAPLGMKDWEAVDAAEDAWVAAVADHLRGYLRPDTVLGAFGGAGPFCVCAIADAVDVKKIIVPSMAAVFSASGIGESEIGHRYDDTVPLPIAEDEAQASIEALIQRARQDMFAEGFGLENCTLTWMLAGEDSAATPVETDQIVRALGALKGPSARLELVASYALPRNANAQAGNGSAPLKTTGTRRVRMIGPEASDVPLCKLEDLTPGATGQGPVIIEDAYFTLPVLEGWTFTVTAAGDIELTRD